MRLYSFALPALLLALATGAEECGPVASTRAVEESTVESNQQRLIATTPAPQLQQSLERKNIIERLQRINKPDQISYIYLVNYGKVMAHYTVRGKVSSLNSYLMTQERVITRGSEGIATVEAPDLDGTYGQNADGVFFFTTENALVEWRGDYLWCDQPLKLTQPPELVLSLER